MEWNGSAAVFLQQRVANGSMNSTVTPNPNTYTIEMAAAATLPRPALPTLPYPSRKSFSPGWANNAQLLKD